MKNLGGIKNIIDFACELINIPTIAGDSGQLEGYRKISTLISNEMKRIGLFVELWECEPGFINVIGRKKGGTSKRSLLFNGHVDVAPTRIEDWATDPFKAAVKDGRIYGGGASDMKGGIVAMIFATERAITAMDHLNGELILTATVDEEIGGFRGLKYLVDEGLKADMTIVCEPTNLEIANYYKGLFWVKVVARGKESHGSLPENGINAISKMAKIINELADFSTPFSSHDILGKPTLNIGKIVGGTNPNVVPSLCEIELDVRFLPGQSIEKMLRRIQELIEKVVDDDPDINWEFSPIIRKRMPLEIKEDEPLIQLIQEATQKATGKYPLFRGMTSPGDSEHLIKAGIPAVMFGPGNIRDAHLANEWIEIDQIVSATEIYAEVIRSFFS